MVLSPDTLINELSSKSLQELLSYIGLGKLTGEGLIFARKKVKELWEKMEYGFTPQPELASELQRISNSEAYKRIRECIGHHKFLGLIKLGLRIEELSDEGKAELISKIKNNVYQKHGIEGARILTMGSTGILIGIIQYLSFVKIENNYDQSQMADLFNKILLNWQKITIFHQSDKGEMKLETKILSYMNDQYDLFFVFSIGTASKQAAKVIASLNKTGTIGKKGYMFNLYSRKEDMAGRVLHAWVFQNIKEFKPFV